MDVKISLLKRVTQGIIIMKPVFSPKFFKLSLLILLYRNFKKADGSVFFEIYPERTGRTPADTKQDVSIMYCERTGRSPADTKQDVSIMSACSKICQAWIILLIVCFSIYGKPIYSAPNLNKKPYKSAKIENNSAIDSIKGSKLKKKTAKEKQNLLKRDIDSGKKSIKKEEQKSDKKSDISGKEGLSENSSALPEKDLPGKIKLPKANKDQAGENTGSIKDFVQKQLKTGKNNIKDETKKLKDLSSAESFSASKVFEQRKLKKNSGDKTGTKESIKKERFRKRKVDPADNKKNEAFLDQQNIKNLFSSSQDKALQDSESKKSKFKEPLKNKTISLPKKINKQQHPEISGFNTNSQKTANLLRKTFLVKKTVINISGATEIVSPLKYTNSLAGLEAANLILESMVKNKKGDLVDSKEPIKMGTVGSFTKAISDNKGLKKDKKNQTLFFNISKDQFDLILKAFLFGSIGIVFLLLRIKKSTNHNHIGRFKKRKKY